MKAHDVRSFHPGQLLATRKGATTCASHRTPYKGDRKISFVSYHTRAISMNIVRATAWTLHDAAQKAKGRLCGKRAGSPAALG